MVRTAKSAPYLGNVGLDACTTANSVRRVSTYRPSRRSGDSAAYRACRSACRSTCRNACWTSRTPGDAADNGTPCSTTHGTSHAAGQSAFAC